jgi:hypothetical protein
MSPPVHFRMSLNNPGRTGQSAARAAHLLFMVRGYAGSVLVHPHDGCINHLHRSLVGGCQGFYDPIPDAPARRQRTNRL